MKGAAGLCRGGGPALRAAFARARAIQVAYKGALVTWAIHGEGTVADAIDEAVTGVLS